MKRRRKFILNGIILSIVGLMMRGVGLLLSGYISRTVGALGIGLNSLVMNVYGFAFTFATAGITLAVTALVAGAIGEGSRESESSVLKGAFLYAFIFGLSASVILFASSGVIAERILGDGMLEVPLKILSLSLIPSAISCVVSGYFIGRRRVVLNSALQIFGQTMRVVFTVTLLSRAKGGDTISYITALASGVTLTESILLILSLLELYLARVGVGGVKKAPPRIGDVARITLPLALSAYARSFLITLEHAIIPGRLLRHGDSKSEALASYGALHGMALPLILYTLVPLSSFGSLLLPEFSEAKARGERKRMKRIASLSLGGSLRYASFLSTLLFFFSEELGYAVYHSREAGRYIAILSLVVPLMFLDHVADNMLKGIGEQVYSMWVNILDSLLSLALVFFLLPHLGIEGYAVVIILMEGFNFALSASRLHSRVGFSIAIVKDGLIPLSLGTLSALITRHLFSPSGSDTPIFVTVSSIIFCIALYIALLKLFSFLHSLFKERVENHHRRKPEKEKIGRSSG